MHSCKNWLILFFFLPFWFLQSTFKKNYQRKCHPHYKEERGNLEKMSEMQLHKCINNCVYLFYCLLFKILFLNIRQILSLWKKKLQKWPGNLPSFYGHIQQEQNIQIRNNLYHRESSFDWWPKSNFLFLSPCLSQWQTWQAQVLTDFSNIFYS